MWVSAFLMVAGIVQSAPSAHQQLAERFVDAAMPETPPVDPDDDSADFFAEMIIRANPGHEVDARRIAREMVDCMSRDRAATMRQAGIEAALAFEPRQLERLIRFAEEMRDLQRGALGSSILSSDSRDALQDYKRWMYSIGGQSSVVALAEKCGGEMSVSLAASGLRE